MRQSTLPRAIPRGWGREAAPRSNSETRLQAAVVAPRPDEKSDPNADVPCTD